MCDRGLRHWVMCGVALLFVVSLRGQTAVKLILFADEPCRELQGPVEMIVGGDEQQRLPLKDLGTCHWETREKDRTFSASFVSFRFPGGRSGCYRAEIENSDTVEPVALVDLCCRAIGRSVSVERIERKMPIGYLRIFGTRDDARNRKRKWRGTPVPCTAPGSFGNGTGVLEQAVASEQVRLQFDTVTPDPNRFGLLVDPHMEKTLSRDDVFYQLLAQSAKGIDGSAPTLSPNALDITARKLRRIGLTQLQVTVK